jgi:hypothetical protein
MCRTNSLFLALILVLGPVLIASAVEQKVPLFGILEQTLHHSGTYQNSYVDASATATLARPDGATRTVPLFWDGENIWRFRFSPDVVGAWRWRTTSDDNGLGGKSGSFTVVPSDRKGSIRPMTAAPHHFERQDGTPFWFLGDTAWALYTDSVEEKHNRRTAMEYVDARADQGFNIIHSMLLSEAGWGNQGGPPFDAITAETLNPGYWQEVDVRLRHVNDRGIVAGLAIAWGDKGRNERYAWKRLPTMESRLRYARYIAARYSAFDLYFLVSGEWHGEVKTTPGATEESIKQQFIEIAGALHSADPHGRMIGIHPMTAHGSVREFVGTPWMSFGDYQQNYRDLHGRILQSRGANLPVVNSEYAYFLRDQNGDGLVDKDNSFDLESIRHASWDIAMAGGYLVTGFGTTYFGGNRDPGPFNLHAEKNDPWEKQIHNLPTFFTSLPWWTLQPHDEWIKGPFERDSDGAKRSESADGRPVSVIAPPNRTYWLLADPGKIYVAYVRGGEGPYEIQMEQPAPKNWDARVFDPRNGQFQPCKLETGPHAVHFKVPDRRDWLLICTPPKIPDA